MNNDKRTWMHIGAGSFHRAHQAWYLNQLIKSGDDTWSIALGSVRDDTTPMLEKLAAQGYRYTLETVDPANNRNYENIVSIREVLPWSPDLSAMTNRGADPATRVISFTVTEGGYYLDTGFRLDQANPDLQEDLQGGNTTIYGAVRAILEKRRQTGGGAVTLLSCDNVRHNGSRFRDGLLEFLRLRGDRDLLEWVEANTACPCCMVDRITPRPGPDIAPRVLEKTGFVDAVPVMGESFIQWVIEDDFMAGRPALENVGVLMVDDVQPYEEAKIRILNVSHAGVAWAGTLSRLNYIHEDTLTPAIRKMAEDYISHDVIPCLTPCPLDLAAYRDTVLDRFANANIQDTNQRVAADGFSKIPAMVVPTLKECFAHGREPVATMMLPAVFFVYLQRWAEGKLPYDYQDGVMNPERTMAMFRDPDPVAAYAGDASLFGPLAGRAEFVALLRDSIEKARSFDKL